MKKLKVAVIGLGVVHEVHVDSIKNSDFCELSYVVDKDEEKAKNMANKYKCSYESSFENIINNKDIDILNICTPHYLHGKMAISAMKNGKDVFCEKPMAITVKECEEMINVSEETGKKLGICFQNRYNNTSIKMKEIIDRGTLGDIKGIKSIITWARDSSYYTGSQWRGFYNTEGGGVLINQSIHTIDLIQWICGYAERVKGNVDTRIFDNIIEVEDTAEATLFLKNGARWFLYATVGHTFNEPIDILIHCEKGILRLYDNELYIIKKGVNEKIASDKVKNTRYPSYWGNSHGIAINEFYKSIINDSKEYISGQEAKEAIKIIEAINKSSKNRTWVNINK